MAYESGAYYGPPVWSPDGKTIAVTKGFGGDPSKQGFGDPPPGREEGDVVLVDVQSGAQTVLYDAPIDQGIWPPLFWLSDGRLAWNRRDDNRLVAYDFTNQNTQPFNCQCGPSGFNLAQTEALVIGYNEAGRKITASWVNLSTGELRPEFSLPYEPYYAVYFALSPDNKYIAMSGLDGDIFLYTVGSGASPTLLIPARASGPTWSPDGSKIAYVDVDPNKTGYTYYGKIYVANADGSTPEPLLASLPEEMFSPAWSPDGAQIAFLYGIEGSYNALVIADVPEPLRPASDQPIQTAIPSP